ncbi:unnamed protein product [Urochloa humidicola]
MANFPCNPMLYVSMGMQVEGGWLRPARSRVALGGEPPRQHEQCAIIRLQPEPAQEQVTDLIQDVSEFLEDEFPVRVQSGFPSPLGLGLFQFDSPVQRQILIDASPIPFGHGSLVVQRHDESINLRACAYIRQCWVMFLAFPLDYQTLDFIKAVVAPFGHLLHWFEGPNKSRILTQCLVVSPDRVPRSVVVSQGSVNGGFGRSWSVPVYILDGHFPDAFPGNEDPVPEDGNPHPVHGPVHNVNINAAQHWHHEQMGGQQGNQMEHGINEQHWQAAQNDLAALAENGAANQGWDAWPDNVADNMVVNDEPDLLPEQVPQHPDRPQDTISFDQSGSSAEYLRATGPDITLTLEDVQKIKAAMQVEETNDVSSAPEPMFKLSAAFKDCELIAFGRLDLGAIHQPSLLHPILDRAPFLIHQPARGKRSWNKAFQGECSSSTREEDLSRAIVPYQPVLHVVLLQIWAQQVAPSPGPEHAMQGSQENNEPPNDIFIEEVVETEVTQVERQSKSPE